MSEVCKLDLVSRNAWNALFPKGEFQEHLVDRITIHHSGVGVSANVDAKQRVRGHQRYHMQELGWPDIAYHIIVGPGGELFEGRASTYQGDTRTRYNTSGHFAICVEGNFEEQRVPLEQFQSLVRVTSWACVNFSIDPFEIGGHRDYCRTLCPGKFLYKHIVEQEFAKLVTESINLFESSSV